MTPIVTTEIIKWLVDFFIENPPRKVNKPNTNIIPPNSIPKYSKKVRKKITNHLIISVVTICVMWSIFTFGLKVILPEGELIRIW